MQVGSASDDALLAAVADGDSRAFESLVRRHLDAIYGYLYRLTGSAADAEDLAQETFLRVWQKAGSYAPGRVRAATWLHTIAHRLAVDGFRKRRELTRAVLPEKADERADPATQQAALEQQRLLDQALTQLPERQRAAILLCQVQGFSNAQAAEIIGVKVRALESLLARARRSLRESLAATGSPAA